VTSDTSENRRWPLSGADAYPAAPWGLRGWGVQVFAPVALATAREFVPEAVSLLPVWPGKTLAALYFGTYVTGSSLVYNELIIAAALVAIDGRFGFWFPRLYVDSPASLAGGHAIWGLPKRLASFELDFTKRARNVRVACDGRMLCELEFSRSTFRLPLWSPVPAFGALAGRAVFFRARLHASVGSVRPRVTWACDSPFTKLGFERSRFGAACDDMRLHVPAPHATRARLEQSRTSPVPGW